MEEHNVNKINLNGTPGKDYSTEQVAKLQS